MLKQFDMSILHTPQRPSFQLPLIKGKNVHQEIKQSRISKCKCMYLLNVTVLTIYVEMYVHAVISNEIHVQKRNVEIS